VTGQAARLLGSSRQHVVDLCDRGELRSVRVGAHRRVAQEEIERVLAAAGRLSRAEERALWLHRALLARLAAEPEAVLAVGRTNLERLREVHGDSGMTAHWLAEWERVLSAGVDAVGDALTSLSPRALELRHNSPFAGVISQETRSKVLAAFTRHWRTEHV
jgi:excisionase family DNA binding protein